jgi:hypothetical protein
MAENKVVNTTQLEADLTSIADAIRVKTKTTGGIKFPEGFVEAIDGIAGSSAVLVDETFTLTSDVTSGKTQVVYASDELVDLAVPYIIIIERVEERASGVNCFVKVSNVYGAGLLCCTGTTWSSKTASYVDITATGQIRVAGKAGTLYAGDYRLYVLYGWGS